MSRAELDAETYERMYNQLRYGAIRLDICRNEYGRIPHCMLEWMIDNGDAETFTAADGREWVKVREDPAK